MKNDNITTNIDNISDEELYELLCDNDDFVDLSTIDLNHKSTIDPLSVTDDYLRSISIKYAKLGNKVKEVNKNYFIQYQDLYISLWSFIDNYLSYPYVTRYMDLIEYNTLALDLILKASNINI